MKHDEHKIQCAIHGWLESHFDCEVVAVPNGGFRGRLEAGRLKLEGVQAGHPDLIVYGPDRSVTLIETKTRTGALQPSQKHFFPRLGQLGFPVHVVRSLDDVKELAPTLGLPPRRPAAAAHVGGF